MGCFVRACSSVARRAAYLSLDASPAESRIGRSLMRRHDLRGSPNTKGNFFGGQSRKEVTDRAFFAPASQSFADIGWENPVGAAPGSAAANSCSLYCSWYNR